ncbi:MAG: methylated-DNA--[protein]-cysteine S-methyltransferase [Lachnospiraceae bacterium]|nr:methylated-DNA--[protein]-cysteine S-methyltransferase [Lachnospiraceae bacterium]
MQYTTKYETPLGSVLLAADETGLTGLWFDRARYYAAGLAAQHEEKEMPVFEKVRTWLDLYFAGKRPERLPPLHMIGSPFRVRIWEMLLQIPYGQTMTYGELAAQIAKERGIERMSAQAVGGAVAHNPISILIPCHRMVGTNGSLTGYAGGIPRKIELLILEGAAMENLFVPTKGTAL